MSALPAEPGLSPGSAGLSPAGARPRLTAVPPGAPDARPSGQASEGELGQIRAAQHGASGARRQAGPARRRLGVPGSAVTQPPRRRGVPGSAALQLPHQRGVPGSAALQLPHQRGVPGSAALQLPHQLGVPGPAAKQLPRRLGVPGSGSPQLPRRLGVSRSAAPQLPRQLGGSAASPRLWPAAPRSSASSFPRLSEHRHGLRLTRRGRVVLIAAVTLVASMLGFGLASAAMATDHHVPVSSAHRGLSRIVVQPGQTLWSIAVRTDPSADPRLIVQRILELNGLSSGSIAAGQRLWIPQG